MANLVTDSLKYPTRSDALVRVLVVGGLLTFAYELLLRAALVSATPGGATVFGSPRGAPVAVQGALLTLGVVSFVVLSGFWIRLTERVAAGESRPPRFSDVTRLLLDGSLFAATLLAVIAAALVVQLGLFAAGVGVVVVAEAYLGVPSLDTLLFLLWMSIVVVPLALVVVYPQPSIWILVARFRLREADGTSYARFVASRRFVAELWSILFSRRYASSWLALVVVSMLQGAATIRSGSLFVVDRPVRFVVQLNGAFVAAVVGFYASMAVVYIFAFRFREPERHGETTPRDESFHDGDGDREHGSDGDE